MSMQLSTGAAFRDITPDLPVMLQGYGARTRLSDGIDDRISVGALALEQAGTLHLILTFDMIGIQARDARRLADLVGSQTGVEPDNITICCSHSHFAPGISPTVMSDPEWGLVEPDPRYVALTTSRTIDAAQTAIKKLEYTQLATYRCRVPHVGFNRRALRPDGSVETSFLYPESGDLSLQPIDDELICISFTRESGGTTLLLNFGCHPVTGGIDREQDFYHISADYIAAVRASLALRGLNDVFFILGAAGDVVPMNRGGHNRELIGSSLASAALLGARAYRRAPQDSKVISGIDYLEATSIIDPSESSASAYAGEREKLLATAPDERDDAPFLRELHRMFRLRLYPDGRCKLAIQSIRIGPVVLVALPFEVFASTSLELKRRFPHVVIISCANGYEGYLPPVREIERGGYETEIRSTHFLPGTEEKITALVSRRLASF